MKMKKRPIIVFSTITGNGYKMACAAAQGMPCDYLGPYNIRYINDEVVEKFDTFVLTYWCNHGTADDDTIELIHKLKGKNLIILGTLGASSDSAHAEKVRANVKALAEEENNLIAQYLCVGSIDLKRTYERTKIPEGEKGHLPMERFERQKLTQGHPNEAELGEASRVVNEAISTLL